MRATMDDRKRDALVAEHVMGLGVIEWRICATDPASGQWEELQEWATENGYAEGDVLWMHPAERQPCYVTRVRLGEIKDWNVVKFYSTDHTATYEMETEIERRGLQEKYIYALADVVDPDMHVGIFDTAVERQHPSANIQMFLWALAHATPAQRVEAALRAVGVNPDA